MRLYEEYLSRHQINDVPMVHHALNSCIFFKLKDINLWAELVNQSSIQTYRPLYGIFQVRWIQSDHHPGHYEASIYNQIHDGYAQDKILNTCQIANLKWHEYENFMQIYTKKFKKFELIKGQNETFLAGWEMFVGAFDGWFAKQGGDIKYMLFQSLDEDVPVNFRMEYASEILRKISHFHTSVMRSWKNEVFQKIQNYSEWLVKLIEKDEKELLPCKD